MTSLDEPELKQTQRVATLVKVHYLFSALQHLYFTWLGISQSRLSLVAVVELEENCRLHRLQPRAAPGDPDSTAATHPSLPRMDRLPDQSAAWSLARKKNSKLLRTEPNCHKPNSTESLLASSFQSSVKRIIYCFLLNASYVAWLPGTAVATREVSRTCFSFFQKLPDTDFAEIC